MELERLCGARHAAFLRVAARVTGDLDAAHDAVQDGFAQACHRLGEYEHRGSLEAWVWTIVLNEARRERRRGRWGDASPAAPRPAEAPELADDQRVRASLAGLPERQRLVVFLRYYADLDDATVAEILGIRTGTVSATLHRRTPRFVVRCRRNDREL